VDRAPSGQRHEREQVDACVVQNRADGERACAERYRDDRKRDGDCQLDCVRMREAALAHDGAQPFSLADQMDGEAAEEGAPDGLVGEHTGDWMNISMISNAVRTASNASRFDSVFIDTPWFVLAECLTLWARWLKRG
jgi:hypothetical protein